MAFSDYKVKDISLGGWGRKELNIAEAFEPFAAITLGYSASIPPSHSRERPEIVWV